MGYTKFTPITSRPKSGDKHYTKTTYSGVNTAVLGKPAAWKGSVLSNCVGFVQGRWIDIAKEITGTYNNVEFSWIKCDAENVITYAKKYGYEVGDIPRPGAIACWMKGKPGVHSDGAGHVCTVEEVFINEAGEYSWRSGESAWEGSAYKSNIRTNANGRWGQNSKYEFRGFIYHPNVKYIPDPPAPKPEPEPEPTVELKVGDKVKIIAKGNATSYGTGKKANGVGWTRSIKKIYSGRPYPYQVGNKLGTTGFYKEDALKKL